MDAFVFVGGLVGAFTISFFFVFLALGAVGTFISGCRSFTRPQRRQIAGLPAR